MKSLGVIETQGWVAAIQAVDAACKSAGVSCTGYRKVGSGLVSVCFAGEISAIHSAIDRGVAAASALGLPVNALIIARPEPSVVMALSTLKGRTPCSEDNVSAPAASVAFQPVSSDTDTIATPQGMQPEQVLTEEKSAAGKRGRKA